MPNLTGMFPFVQNLVASATVTTNGTTASMALPYCQSYRFITSINTVTGTLPTLVVTIATSFDGGTTFNDVITSTTMSTTGIGTQIVFKPYLGAGDIATSQTVTLSSITTIAPTGGTVTNGPIDPRYVKIKWVVGGTTPSFSAVTIGVIGVMQDASD